MSSSKKIAAHFALALAFLALVGASTRAHRKQKVLGPNIQIDMDHGLFFVSTDDVRNKLATVHDNLNKLTVDQVNCALIERAVEELSEVKNAEVFIDIDGTLHIELTQRQPLVRVIPKYGSGFYIDRDGKYMPLSKNYSARVLVINGEFQQKFKYLSIDILTRYDSLKNQTLFDEFFQLASFIEADSLWSSQIQQVYVNENNEFELIPRIGNHNIELGNTTDLPEKFKKLYIFYREGLPYSDWNKYSKISLKYKNQVVCTLKPNAI